MFEDSWAVFILAPQDPGEQNIRGRSVRGLGDGSLPAGSRVEPQ